jgi:hypothetical protein
MGIRPSIEVLPPPASKVPAKSNAVAIPILAHMVTVPQPFVTPKTTWGAKRQTNYYRALTALTNSQSEYLRARGELAKSFVAVVRAANEVAELPEICQNDTRIRQTQRERDYLNARRELEEARYGVLATQDEVTKLRQPKLERSKGHPAAVEALMKAKIDREALGEDTSDLDQTLLLLQGA